MRANTETKKDNMYSINGHLLPLERVDSTFIVSIRRNGVKGGRSPFILTLDGEGADTLRRQGKAVASPLAPFRAGGIAVKRATLARVPGGKPGWVSIGSRATFARASP